MAVKNGYKPTLDECKAWRDTLNGQWSAGHGGGLSERQRQEEALYFQHFPLMAAKDDPSDRPVRVGSAPADVDSAVDALVPNDILVRCKPARNKKKYQRQSELLIRGGRSFLNLWRQDTDVLRSIATDQCLRSVGCARVLYEDELWDSPPPELEYSEDDDDENELDEWEIEHRGSVPIVLEWRNSRYVRFKLDRRGRPLVVVETYPTTVLEAKATYGHLPLALDYLDTQRLESPVDIDDIWFGQYRCILIDNRPIFGEGEGAVAKHIYPEIPYVFCSFREMTFDAPGERYRGVLTNQSSVYPAESQAVSMHMTMLRTNAWRTYKGWTRDNREIIIRPGYMTPIDQRFGEYLDLMQGEPVSPEVLQTAAMLEGYRMQNGVGQMGLRSQEGARSAQQVMAQQAIAEKKIAPARASLQRLVANALRLAFMIIQEVLEQPITLPSPGRDSKTGEWLGQVRITPDDVNSYWDNFDVYFTRRVDPAQLEQAKALSALASANWMPWRASVELSGFCDTPSEWEDDLYIQAADHTPFMLESAGYERIKTFYEGDKDEWLVELYKQRMLQQEAQQQPGGGPGMPSPGAQAAPNVLKGMQAPEPPGAPSMGQNGGGHPNAGPGAVGPLPAIRGQQGGAGRPIRGPGGMP